MTKFAPHKAPKLIASGRDPGEQQMDGEVRVDTLVFGVHDLGFGVRNLGFRVQGSGFGVQGSGLGSVFSGVVSGEGLGFKS